MVLSSYIHLILFDLNLKAFRPTKSQLTLDVVKRLDLIFSRYHSRLQLRADQEIFQLILAIKDKILQRYGLKQVKNDGSKGIEQPELS